jgi:hypothetical protein
MTDLIYVRPAPALRCDFAVWAVAQTPKVRTADPQTFAVPPRLFVAAPEELLIGSVVDGHRYVSPYEDEADEEQPTVLVGEDGPESVVPMRTAVPGEPLPDAAESAYGSDSASLASPDFAPLEYAPVAGEGGHGGGAAPADGPHACKDCGRSYATGRGLNRHRSSVHGGRHGR